MEGHLEILRFYDDNELDMDTGISHLSPLHSRSESNVRYDHKRKKPNTTRINKTYILEQKEKATIKAHEALRLVLNGDKPVSGYEIYYRYVESLCRFKHNEQSILADHIELTLKEYFEHQIAPEMKKLFIEDTFGTQTMVDSLMDTYECWLIKLKVLSKIFLYLDANYLQFHPSRSMIAAYGQNLFVQEFFETLESSEAVVPKVLYRKHKEILSEIRRNKKESYLSTSKRLSKVLAKYPMEARDAFEGELLDLIAADYQLMRSEWLMAPNDYIHNTLREISREVTYFKESDFRKSFMSALFSKLKWITIFQDFQNVIHISLPILLQDQNESELRLIHEYCERSIDEYLINSTKMFLYEWGKHIETLIQDTLDKNKENLKNFIPALASLYTRLKEIADTVLSSNEVFEFELRNSFTKMLNDKHINHTTLVQLCKYCDSFFKNSSKKGARPDISTLSFAKFRDNVQLIVKCLNNKNDFLVLYKRDLSKRLLMGRSTDTKLEASVVESFIKVIGETDEVLGLKAMFRDLETSKDKFSLLLLDDCPFDFSAYVLEQKFWPDPPKGDSEAHLPPYLSDALGKFTAFYKSEEEKHADKRLDWSHYSLHQLVIKGSFESGDKDLIVNLLQAVVILLFNEKDNYSFDEIAGSTGIDPKLLKRVLLSLTSDRFNILISNGSLYSFNFKFTDRLNKIRIPFYKDRESSAHIDRDNADRDIMEKNRDTEIKCILVRIMKREKVMLYSDLVYQTLEHAQTKGPCDVSDIKIQLDYLIANEFVKRESDGKTFTYIP